ncbi:MAG: hypothetical protein KJO35_02190 [Gammaproteobacteria bacterium]|nr:hypothetical protein [Gammaproteobacteria bacterium]
MIKKSILLVLLCLPVAAWAFAKPIRILAPGVFGVVCHGAVCVEDEERSDGAVVLYDEAYAFVESRLSKLHTKPRVIFCSTTRCYRFFGGGRELAISYPRIGSIISAAAWKPHFVRHELIHHLQFQQLGAVGTMLDPAWFREGMAYSVSEPPEQDLPPQFREYQERYDLWSRSVDPGQLWVAAKRL